MERVEPLSGLQMHSRHCPEVVYREGRASHTVADVMMNSKTHYFVWTLGHGLIVICVSAVILPLAAPDSLTRQLSSTDT